MLRTRPARRLAVWLLLAAGQSPVVTAGPLTLQDAIRIALKRDPGVAVARAEAEASAADLESARFSRWPRLVAEAAWHRTDGQVAVFSDKLSAAEFTAADFTLDSLNHPDPLSHGSIGLVLEGPLFTSGRIRHSIEATGEASLASRERLRGASDELVSAVTQAYDGVLRAEAMLDIARGSLESARGHERVAAGRYDSGAALKSDALRAQVHRMARERNLERQKADLEIARARLRALLGLPQDEDLSLVDADRAQSSEPLGELKSWVAAVDAGHPEIEAARHASAAAAAEGRAEGAARGPQVSGTARYDHHANGLDGGDGSYFAGLQIRWNAFDRVRAPRIEAAQARADAAEASRRSVEEGVRLEVEQAWREAGLADRNVAIARQAVEAATEARRITDERYAGGLLPLTDLLDSETELLHARLDEIGARFDALAARVRLERAAGRLEVPR